MRLHGAQAATFTELFAEVLHPVAPAESGRPEPGADLHAALTVPFEESMHGGERQVVVTRQDVCRGCHGRGAIRTPEGKCAPCHGTGKVKWARGHMVFTKACAACHGSPHAITPTVQPRDNMQAIQWQGHPGTIDTCTVCHDEQPDEKFPHSYFEEDDD